MQRVSEILKSSKKRLEDRKNLVKESQTKPPDLLDLQEAKKFLTLPQKAKDKLAENDPVEWQRLVDLGNKVWGQCQSSFMSQDKDAEHPFIDGLYIKGWKDTIESIFKGGR